MTAVFLAPGVLGLSSSASLYLSTAIVLLVVGAVAPARVRTDRRAVALVLIVLVLAVIGQPTYAFASRICDWAWFAIECWFS